MRFYSSEQLGPTQSQLPSGALLCQGVVIARTGQQLYHASEIGTGSGDPWNDNMVSVLRDESEVFDPDSMASFEGAPVVMQHPSGMVAPDNWRALAVGHAQNVRRSSDTLVADLVVHDKRAIEAIRHGGWRGVSCGYNASYEAAAGGQLRQTDITGNHIAILPPGEAARCGDLCAIGDSAMSGRKKMSEETSAETLQSIRAINATIDKLARHRRRTRDQDLSTTTDPKWVGQQWTRSGGVVSEPTAGPKRILKLDGPATSYWVQSAADGVWLVQSSNVQGVGDPGKTTIPAITDALSRHRAATAARDAGGQFAKEFNERQRARWGR
jgi:hypothetical protein